MIVVVVGPTAIGKSGLALALAEDLIRQGRPAEIVNADSMLIYRGMDIGTAKPDADERRRVVHHLIDTADISETASVAEFQTSARAAIADCLARGALPIVVGGSALYIRAVIDDFRFPGTDPDLRARLEAELTRIGSSALHERLRAIDSVAAETILPGNGRRIVRALEVIELTGEPFAATLPGFDYLLDDVVQLGLDGPRPAVDERIAVRVQQMWADGFVEEVRRLADRGLREGLTASRALGYAQVLSFLNGELSEDEAREATIVRTRKFARRQGSWFRRDPRISWLAPVDVADRPGRGGPWLDQASAVVRSA